MANIDNSIEVDFATVATVLTQKYFIEEEEINDKLKKFVFHLLNKKLNEVEELNGISKSEYQLCKAFILNTYAALNTLGEPKSNDASECREWYRKSKEIVGNNFIFSPMENKGIQKVRS